MEVSWQYVLVFVGKNIKMIIWSNSNHVHAQSDPCRNAKVSLWGKRAYFAEASLARQNAKVKRQKVSTWQHRPDQLSYLWLWLQEQRFFIL